MRASLVTLGLLAACGGQEAAAPLPRCTDPARGPAFDRFDEATTGITFRYSSPDYRGGGLAVGDLDGDGLPDLVLGSRVGGLALYRNRGGLHFEAVANSGLDPTLLVNAITAVDLDNDGDLDLVIAGPGTAVVMANQGDGTFVTAAEFPRSGATEQVLAVDLDGDGLLDLFFSNRDLENPVTTLSRLYMNRGGLQFSPPMAAANSLAWATTAFDFDGDGDQDLYIANDTLLADFGGPVQMETLPPDMLLRNDGIGSDGMPVFTDVSPAMGLDVPRSSMGGTLGDYNDDGQLDIYIPNEGAKKLMLRQDDTYLDDAAQLGVQAIQRASPICTPDTTHEDCLFFSWAAVLTDFDLDGYDELLVTNGVTAPGSYPPLLMFKRGPQVPYEEVSPDLACMDAHAIVATDLDGDGDQDLVVAQKDGPPLVYENRGTPARDSWLRVQLRGTTSNASGVGAVVTAHMVSGRSQIRVVGAGGVVHSSTPSEAFFGLGSDQVATVSVQWPSGKTTERTRPPAGLLLMAESP